MGRYVLNQSQQYGLPAVSEKKLTEPERDKVLEKAVSYKARQGSRIEYRGEQEVVVVTGSKPNHILHLLLTIFTLGLWLIPWIIIGVFGGEKRETLSVNEYGEVSLVT